ncbi:FAD-binding domain-containing protein [Thozetella sp. PMI_491]|nr:FAD-binding domain-containing protein [Thozetella sp. PMI_491]
MYSKLKLLVLSLASLATASASCRCRCRPTDPCWPSTRQWKHLNASLDGHLQAVRPIAYVCHDPTYDAAACSAVTTMSNESAWRITQPGAVQWTNWEAWPERNESCDVDTARDRPCGQGRISLYSAVVQNEAHIQAAVRFARQHDLRLAIKNTGHCFLGRSSAPESFQIATFSLNSTNFTDSFVPEGGRASEGPAVTIGAGVVLKHLYDAVAAQNVTVIAGLSHTVGAAGGYVQGGGHSPFGGWKGLAADNALEFRVVTATGDLVVANQYKNKDLFWALRGGGGGTFGVVTSVTLRTFPEIPVISTSVILATSNATAYWEALRVFHANLPAMNDAGASGYYFLNPSATSDGMGVATIALFFSNVSDVAYGDRVWSSTVKSFNDTGASVVYRSDLVPESKYLFALTLTGDSDSAGVVSRPASRLVSHAFLSSPDGPSKLVDAMTKIGALAPGQSFIGHVVAGGLVARNTSDSAVNPAWRRAVTHIAWGTSWGHNATLAEQKVFTDRLTYQQSPLMKALEPDMGAYLNEADPGEINFQQSFWGANYPRLLKVKRKWDPRALFITRRGVGSEEWDEAGLCRV